MGSLLGFAPDPNPNGGPPAPRLYQPRRRLGKGEMKSAYGPLGEGGKAGIGPRAKRRRRPSGGRGRREGAGLWPLGLRKGRRREKAYGVRGNGKVGRPAGRPK